MARKIIALVLAALMLAVAGCSGQLNEEKYYEKLTDNIREYLVLSDDVSAQSELGSACDASQLSAAIDRAEKPLNAIMALNPPDSLSEKHQELCNGLELQKQWLAAIRQAIADGWTIDSTMAVEAAKNSDFSVTALEMMEYYWVNIYTGSGLTVGTPTAED